MMADFNQAKMNRNHVSGGTLKVLLTEGPGAPGAPTSPSLPGAPYSHTQNTIE